MKLLCTPEKAPLSSCTVKRRVNEFMVWAATLDNFVDNVAEEGALLMFSRFLYLVSWSFAGQTLKGKDAVRAGYTPFFDMLTHVDGINTSQSYSRFYSFTIVEKNIASCIFFVLR